MPIAEKVVKASLVKRRPDAGQRFPFIPLPKALDRARELYKVATTYEVPIATALRAWSYAEKSSGGLQTAAALKAFGLLEDMGGNEVRKVKLTDVALRIIRDPRDISPDRDALVRQTAMRPPLHREVIEKYDGMPPSDEALKAFLMIDRNLKDDAVHDFIREFTATMAYAKVTEQATIRDMEFFPEETVAEDFLETAKHTPGPTRHTADTTAAARALALEPQPMLPSIRREIFALDEGDVILTFPDNLSADSYEDLEAHLQLFLRKAKRRATSDQRDREFDADVH